MKTRIIITALGVALLATINLPAGDALLSPRAKANLITVAPGSGSGPNLAAVNRDRTGSPRALANETARVRGTEIASATKTCAVIGTPRQAGMFGSCCKVSKASCAATIACCAK